MKHIKLFENYTDQRVIDNALKTLEDDIKELEGNDRYAFQDFLEYYKKGDKERAFNQCSYLDTFLREMIPASIWKDMGGDLTPNGVKKLEIEIEKSK